MYMYVYIYYSRALSLCTPPGSVRTRQCGAPRTTPSLHTVQHRETWCVAFPVLIQFLAPEPEPQ